MLSSHDSVLMTSRSLSAWALGLMISWPFLPLDVFESEPVQELTDILAEGRRVLKIGRGDADGFVVPGAVAGGEAGALKSLRSG